MRLALLLLLSSGACFTARGEAMLELFNVNWSELIRKMPEIAEAGYDSLWLPPPAKGGSSFSVGYDEFDAFDLGDKYQRGTVATRWGTKDQLLQVVETAHRFGIRVYFDHVMNHRAFDTPGFNANTPTNLYPGLVPADFHLKTVGQYYQNWPSVENYNNLFDVQYESLSGLIDLANEPGATNGNFGPTLGSTIAKPVFVRQPNNPEYYMNTNLPPIAGPWHPFSGSNGDPVPEDVNAYLIRAAMWTLYTTKCDGFRLDAVKHVPSGFFGDSFDSPNGFTGGIQTMFDYVHGYGTNATGNGYVESDGNRNSVFDTEAPRNDAMLFGEHLGAPPSFGEYLARGMRLLNAPLQGWMNNALAGNASLFGADGRDFAPNGGFSQVQGVQFAQSQDQSSCCATHRELQNAYYFLHEGLPEIYSDGYNLSQAPPGQFPFPNNAFAPYLGQFGNNQMPEIAWVHHQLARGGTRSRWGDQNTVVFERYDYRDVAPPAQYASAYTNPHATVVLFAMNDKYDFPGDISFDDGVNQASDGYYGTGPVSNSRNIGVVVGFPPGSVLSQLATSSPGGDRAYPKLLVHAATTSFSAAQQSANNADPVQRLIYIGGQTPAPGGGAIELTIPSGGWVLYGYQWPEASRAALKDAITLRQGGADVPRITVNRRDGVNGDPGFNPIYPFKMRGSVDPLGNVVGGVHVSNLTYAIDIPIVTNANFDIVIRSDASASNVLVKLDGGSDLNSQMDLGPLAGFDLRDHKPGYASDVFLGYETAAFQFRNGPEKFAARDTLSNNIVSLGAETYYYTVGASNNFVVPGSGYGHAFNTQTASWVWHDPTNAVTSLGTNPPAQRHPLNPTSADAVEVWVKVGYQFQINTCYLYYTTDGTNPEGAFGAGKGTTQVIQGVWVDHDSAQTNIDWWKAIIPAHTNGTQLRYKVALFNGGSVWGDENIQPISDADGSKLYGLTQSAITNFNPTAARVWLHNNLNTNQTILGLPSGFHILRARTFLPRAGKSGAFNTFLQTFYFDGGLPGGVIAFPTTNGSTLNSLNYGVVVRADSTVTAADFNIEDSNAGNDDVTTGQSNGNGSSNGSPVFAAATAVEPDAGLTAQYPSYPQEFRFNYANVPTNGTATITVRLKTWSTGVYTNRFTTLTRTVNTLAPAQVVHISNPAADGMVIPMASNVVYVIQTCFTPTLTTNDANLFGIYINGMLQPRVNYIFRPPGAVAGCPGMRSLLYNWSGAPAGTNVIQVIYDNGIVLSDTRTVIVPPPLRITGLANNNQLVVWDSVPGQNYVVLATTNLLVPFTPISPVVPGNGLSTFYFDDSPSVPQKFYLIQVVP